MRIRYLDGARLRRAFLAGCDYATAARVELNAINVFPVPDGDTGTNLALTVSSVADELQRNRDQDAAAVARAAAEAGILGARGNSGMILSHWLIGLADGLGDARRAEVGDMRAALRKAADHLYASLENPVEGTMLTVMREAAEEAEAVDSDDFVDFMACVLERARKALARTPDLLPMLRKAGVVDAGAKGFVQWLEGMSALIRGDPIVARREPLAAHEPSEPMAAHEPSAVAAAEFPTDGGYRFCTEALVRGPDLPADDAARHVLREFGDSLIVIRGEGLLKVHVHTDDPEGVFAYLRGVGRLESHKAEDMTAQKRTLESSTTGLARRPLAIVTDSACDLPEGVIRGHGIHVVPLSLVYEDRALRDGIDIDADTFIQRLRRGEHPRTSQPPPAAFLEAFRHAAQDAEQVLGFTVAGALSGTLGSAQAAARSLDDPAAVQVVDSRGASLCQGLLVLRAAELAELGTPTEEIIAEVQRIRDQSGLYFTVDTFDRLVASGRVSRGRGWLAGALRIKPILRLTPEGSIEAADKVRGSKALLPRVLDHLTRDVGSARNVRFGVVHVDAPDTAEAVRTALVDRFGEKEILVEPATPVLATHLGRRAWGVAYQVED